MRATYSRQARLRRQAPCGEQLNFTEQHSLIFRRNSCLVLNMEWWTSLVSARALIFMLVSLSLIQVLTIFSLNNTSKHRSSSISPSSAINFKMQMIKQRNEHSFLCPIFRKAVPFFISTISHYELFEYWNSLTEKSSHGTLENIGQSKLYSFHNFISLAFSHLHLTECKPGHISIAQVSTNALLINIIDAIAEQKKHAHL